MKRILISCTAITSVIFAACSDKTTDANSNVATENTQTNSEDDYSETISMRLDSLLSDSLDKVYYNMDLSKLSYSELRTIMHYPYAKHAFWFKEYDLNARYMSLEWYKTLIHDTYYEKNLEYGVDELKEDADFDFDKWNNDYDEYKESTELTPEENAFVERVKARMAELEKEKYVNVEGFKLYNAEQIVNGDGIMEDAALANMLQKNGFALQQSGYSQLFDIYENNDYCMIPSYITTDLMLQLFSIYHRYVLDGIEQEAITPALQNLCNGLYKNSKEIASKESNPEIKDFAEFSTTYYAIALSLLNGEKYDVPESYKDVYNAELNLIMAENDAVSPLLKTEVNFGYSQFKPRAQYANSEEGKRYFRTMMWLQTAYLCAKDNGLQKALFMAKVFNDSNSDIKDAAKKAFDPLNYLIGEPNNIPILDLAYKLDKMGITDFYNLLDEDIMAKATEVITAANKSKSSIQPKIQISCQPKINLMPQRYVPDADVLNMMADSVPNAARAYPRGVDVFDAFGIKAAKALNDTFFTDNKEWKEYPMQRKKASNKYANFKDWDKTGYNKWIQMLVDMQNPEKNYPGFMQTSSWQLKNLNSALASWSELKHNTILYSVQPVAAECGGPDFTHLPDPLLVGYVEPNLKFWKTLRQAVENTYNMAKVAGYGVTSDFGGGRSLDGQTIGFLNRIDFIIEISEKELKGEILSDKEYEGIRKLGSDIEYMTIGFLADRHHYADWAAISDVNKNMPVVADIYTRNVLGCNKSGTLHTGVGNANIIYVTVEINGYYYVTRGATFSYYEFVRPVGSRLTDEEWQKLINSDQRPNIPDWITPFMINKPIKKKNVDYLYSSGC